MTTLYFSNYSDPYFVQQRILVNFLQLNLQLQKVDKKSFSLALLTPQGFINEPNAISFYLAQNSDLLQGRNCTFSDIYSWFQFFNIEIHPLLKELYGQISGHLQPQKPRYAYSLQELNKNLKILDEHLKKRSVFAGDSITIVDIMLVCQLQKAFRLLISEGDRKKLPHLTRWYKYVRNAEPFVKGSGKMFLCGQNAFTVEFEKNQAQKKEEIVKKQQENGKVTEDKVEVIEVKQQKKEEIAQKVQVSNSKEEQGQQGQVKEQKYTLDTFKRQFQNLGDPQIAIDNLFKNFTDQWSIWRISYNKDEGQGKIDFQTANLARGTIQRLDALRKTGFGKLGVFQDEERNQYEIRGVMIWKGNQIAKEWKQHPSYEYHEFRRLDLKNQEDKELVRGYWGDAERCQGLALYDSYKLI